MPEILENQTKWKCKFELRDYQRTALEKIETHLADQRIHIVAAPGSGKTILGLEIAGKLAGNVLVFAPTLAIRNQWISRLEENFTAPNQPTTSTSLITPGQLTASTYQSLHAALRGAADEETGETYDANVLETLLETTQILILDEAHHLRVAWSDALMEFVKNLKTKHPELVIIALTATPPYDSTPTEWQRYVELCGEIDVEIPIPQLVAAGDLAPHQDYVVFNYPNKNELQQLRETREKQVELLATLETEENKEALKTAGFFSIEAFDECIDDEVNCVGFLQLLDHLEIAAPANLKALLKPEMRASSFDIEHSVKATNFILGHPQLFPDTLVETLRARTKELGLWYRGKVTDTTLVETGRILLNSAGKLESIAAITHTEIANLGQLLRMLILTDHIRAEGLDLDIPAMLMGVVPIFHTLRPNLPEDVNLAVLTGSLVIIPQQILLPLRALAEELNLDVSKLQTSPLKVDANYLQLRHPQALKLITAAMSRGLIQILVGTAALLGEGWDCPQLNSLVLASTVKATMLTNQMRGRVIRTDPQQPEKVANIWHLATAEAGQLLHRKAERIPLATSYDFRKLEARFETFVGSAVAESVIESGVERCFPVGAKLESKQIAYLNRQTFAASGDRAGVARRWTEALAAGNVTGAGWEVARVSTVNLQARVFYSGYILLAFGIGMLMIFGGRLLGTLVQYDGMSGLVVLIWLLLLGVGVFFERLMTRWASPRRRLKRQASALLASLQQLGLISVSEGVVLHLPKSADRFQQDVALRGVRPHEEKLFSDALEQLYGPVKNPRYLFTPSRRFFGKILFYRLWCVQNVPDVLGGRKENVEVFARCMAENGMCIEVTYTRSQVGRKELLKARRLAAVNVATSFVDEKQKLLPITRL